MFNSTGFMGCFTGITTLLGTIFNPDTGPRIKVSAVQALLIWIIFYTGTVLSLPGDTFSTSQAYYYFKMLGTEDHWACFFLGMASIGMLSFRWPSLRVFSAHALSIAHLILALLIGFGNPRSIATGTYMGLALLGFTFLWIEKSNCYKRSVSHTPRDLGQFISAAMYHHQQHSLTCRYSE